MSTLSVLCLFVAAYVVSSQAVIEEEDGFKSFNHDKKIWAMCSVCKSKQCYFVNAHTKTDAMQQVAALREAVTRVKDTGETEPCIVYATGIGHHPNSTPPKIRGVAYMASRITLVDAHVDHQVDIQDRILNTNNVKVPIENMFDEVGVSRCRLTWKEAERVADHAAKDINYPTRYKEYQEAEYKYTQHVATAAMAKLTVAAAKDEKRKKEAEELEAITAELQAVQAEDKERYLAAKNKVEECMNTNKNKAKFENWDTSMAAYNALSSRAVDLPPSMIKSVAKWANTWKRLCASVVPVSELICYFGTNVESSKAIMLLVEKIQGNGATGFRFTTTTSVQHTMLKSGVRVACSGDPYCEAQPYIECCPQGPDADLRRDRNLRSQD